MYAIFVVLYVAGLEFSYTILLVTYVILIPFQASINKVENAAMIHPVIDNLLLGADKVI